MLVDPDATSARDPVHAQFLHCLVANIPGPVLAPGGKSLAAALPVTAGDFVTSYFPPAPAAGSGAHRYVSLLYAQPGGKTTSIPDPSGGSTTGLPVRRSTPQIHPLIDQTPLV